MNARILAGIVVCLHSISTNAATISECQNLLRTGQYVECLDATTEAVNRRSYGEDWPLLKAEAEIQLGRYPEATETVNEGIQRYAWSIRLRMLAHQLSVLKGDRGNAEKLLDEINKLATDAPWRYTDADDLVALGQAAIELGADPKDVLEGFFDRARRNYKSRPDGHIAAGQLALDKGDFALAAEVLRPAVEQFEDNPTALFLLSEAVSSSTPSEAAELLQRTLEINPNFAPALLRLAERQIDAESYKDAELILAKIHETNPWLPESHALAAVIHHLQNNSDEEAHSRSQALKFSEANPAVDFLIGEQLSRKYRFAEGAAYQRQALAAYPQYLPAKTQLAQDLLRLGLDEDGWKLADDAQKQDKYSTTLFNLMTLKNSLDNFTTISNERFIIRMNHQEATVYGKQVESLLNRAFDTLSEKYQYLPMEPVVVEIFHRKEDFAVRTFGIPDVAGFLGVCFGKVITANSPVSQRESPNNWESVLWHEFCHVITLQMTENKIPRWLSEGISVYEERLQDARWGQSMTPGFRERVLEGNITPVSQLSSAFLNAKTGDDLNFAYYESSMVVEFVVQQYGFDALRGILKELSDGFTINDALTRQTAGIDELDAEFDKYLTELAANYAKDVTFAVAKDEAANLIELASSNAQHYPAGVAVASELVRNGEFAAAESKLQELINLYPEDASPGSARKILALVYKKTNQPLKQAEQLSAHLEHSADDLSAAMELLTLQLAAEQWKPALGTGRLITAIDPLQPVALRGYLQAALAETDHTLAVDVLQSLLELEPSDAARFHFQIAELVQTDDPAEARKHVLMSLEQAPRYRAAHRLLLNLQSADSSTPAGDLQNLPKQQRN
ncbi:MAG: tetratricopeptide repeat protein [Fuerstiella sp.]